jgi:hypothetical protein
VRISLVYPEKEAIPDKLSNLGPELQNIDLVDISGPVIIKTNRHFGFKPRY